MISTVPSDIPTAAPSTAGSPVPTATFVSPSPSMSYRSISPTTTVTGVPIATLIPTTDAPAIPAPMMLPSIMPSTIVDVRVQTTYVIEIKEGSVVTSQSLSDLKNAMDSLAQQVVDETFPDSRTLRRRRLKVSIVFPTEIVGVLNQSELIKTVSE